MPVTPSERRRILKALREGHSQTAVAKEFRRGSATICRIAKAAGLEYSAPKNANICRRDYAQAERLVFLNEIFDKARELLSTVQSPDDLRAIAVTAGILVDKRRLEDGEATTVTENRNADLTRERLASRVDELATRRRQKAVAE
jgi:hypothetical protein